MSVWMKDKDPEEVNVRATPDDCLTALNLTDDEPV